VSEDALAGWLGAPLFGSNQSNDFHQGRIRFRDLEISEFPAGDFGSIRQAVSVETGRLFRSKAAPSSEGSWAPASANRC